MSECLILIPARSGSTRVKNKNIRPLAGKPLVGHVIEAAVQAKQARVLVSTNDEEIAAVARKHGAEVPFLRPDSMAQAESSAISAILHCLDWLKTNENWQPDLLAFCPPTNPFLRPQTIIEMKERLDTTPDVRSIVTIAAPQTHPFRIVSLEQNGKITNGICDIDGKNINDIDRTQDWPEVWEGCPTCRMSRVSYFLELFDIFREGMMVKTYDVQSSLGYKIDRIEAVDIDDEQDFLVAEALSSLRR